MAGGAIGCGDEPGAVGQAQQNRALGAYLLDVLARIYAHPANRIDELLLHAGSQADSAESAGTQLPPIRRGQASFR